MSFKYADEIWKQTKQVRGRLILLVAIARYANEYGLAYPSIETLASDTHTSTRQVKRNIKALVEAGELFVKLGQGRGHFTKYLILTLLSETEIAKALNHLQLPSKDIYSFLAARRQGTVLSPFKSNQVDNTTVPTKKAKGDTIGKEKMTIVVAKGDDFDLKGDISGSKSAVNVSNKESCQTDPTWNPKRSVSDPELHVELALDAVSPTLVNTSEKRVGDETLALATVEFEEAVPVNTPTAREQVVINVAKLRQLDLRLYGKGDMRAGWARLAKECRPLIEIGVTATQVEYFSNYWYSCDFPGMHGKPPTMNQVLELWQSVMVNMQQMPTSLFSDNNSTALSLHNPLPRPVMQPQKNKAERTQEMIDRVFARLEREFQDECPSDS
jgi:hypothetical protein